MRRCLDCHKPIMNRSTRCCICRNDKRKAARRKTHPKLQGDSGAWIEARLNQLEAARRQRRWNA